MGRRDIRLIDTVLLTSCAPPSQCFVFSFVMQQSHSREHEHPKPDFALIGDTHLFRTIKTVVASTQLLTIVGMLATVGTSQNCHQKKRVLSHRTVMNSFPSEKTKKIGKSWGSKIHFTKGNLRQNILICAKLSPK